MLVERKEKVDLAEYSSKLQSYSLEELEDIYFHIDILKQPVEYGMLNRELEARKLKVAPPPQQPKIGNARRWLEKKPYFVSHPQVCNLLILGIYFVGPAVATLLMLLPIWFFASPMNLVGLQTALVYIAYAPAGPISGLVVGSKLGAKRWEMLLPLLGVVLGTYLFYLTGTPKQVYDEIMKPAASGGGSMFGGGF